MGIKDRALENQVLMLKQHLALAVKHNSELTDAYNNVMQILAGVLVSRHSASITLPVEVFPDLDKFRLHFEKRLVEETKDLDKDAQRYEVYVVILPPKEKEPVVVVCQTCGQPIEDTGKKDDAENPIWKHKEYSDKCLEPVPAMEHEERVAGMPAEYRGCAIHKIAVPPGGVCPECLEERFKDTPGGCCGHVKRRHVAGVGQCKDCDCKGFLFKVRQDETGTEGAGTAGDGEDSSLDGAPGEGTEDSSSEPRRVFDVHEGGKARGPGEDKED